MCAASWITWKSSATFDRRSDVASLTFRGLGADHLGAVFEREGRTTSKRALAHMRRVSKRVLEQSVRNSPVDWKGPKGAPKDPGHELERSHKIVEEYGSSRRLEARVTVGGFVGRVNVDLYATWIHEGEYQLGKASVRKAMADPRNEVGPQYLERALQKHEDDFEPLLDELMQGLMG